MCALIKVTIKIREPDQKCGCDLSSVATQMAVDYDLIENVACIVPSFSKKAAFLGQNNEVQDPWCKYTTGAMTNRLESKNCAAMSKQLHYSMYIHLFMCLSAPNFLLIAHNAACLS